MELIIRKMTAEDERSWLDIDDSFTVNRILVPSIFGQQIQYTIQEVSEYVKSYANESAGDEENDDYEPQAYIDSPDRVIYLAVVNGVMAGRIVLKRNWNRYAYVEDIAVDTRFRQHGIGRRLIEQAKQWANEGGMPGIMLETQNNNVGACLFYERCGFMLGGLDYKLYQGIRRQTGEIALFWYYFLEPPLNL